MLAIFAGKEVKCIIEIGDSSYSFTIPATEGTELKDLHNSMIEAYNETLLAAAG